MIKDFWVNLPVKNIEKSREFYSNIGFEENQHHAGSSDCASFFIGEKKVVLMLFKEELFQSFSDNPVSKTNNGTEVLLNIDAASEQEVDSMAAKVEKSNGKIYGSPGYKDGWMYGCGFTDPDGHRWAILHMDYSKMNIQK